MLFRHRLPHVLAVKWDGRNFEEIAKVCPRALWYYSDGKAVLKIIQETTFGKWEVDKEVLVGSWIVLDNGSYRILSQYEFDLGFEKVKENTNEIK